MFILFIYIFNSLKLYTLIYYCCRIKFVNEATIIILGGIGEAVASAVSCCRNTVLKRLAVTGIPRSGPPAALLDMFGISSNHIVKAVMEIKDT